MRTSAWIALLLAAPAALAQVQDPAMQAELNRIDRQLQQSRGETDRLLDLRLRHDLGLPGATETDVFRTDGPVNTQSIETSREQLQSEERATADLLQRFERLKAMAERMQAARPKPSPDRPKDEWTTVPVTGNGQLMAGQRRADPNLVEDQGSSGVPVTAPVPGAAPEAGPATTPVLQLDPVRGQIHGSNDAGRVATALFRAGQALMDRATRLRAEGNAAAADTMDAEARDRLDRAVEALAPVLAVEKPALADLFLLGKCREALFRLAERHDGLNLRDQAREYQRREQEVREPFVTIAARDSRVENGTETLGTWGRAAQAALDHFRWMNLNGAFQPKIDLATIQWERGQRP